MHLITWAYLNMPDNNDLAVALNSVLLQMQLKFFSACHLIYFLSQFDLPKKIKV